MANIKSAIKRSRQAIKRRSHNTVLRSRTYTAIKKARKLIDSKDPAVKDAVKAACSEIDKMVPKGIFAKNKAARLKSRLVAALKKVA